MKILVLLLSVIFMWQVALGKNVDIPLISAQDLRSEMEAFNVKRHPWNTKFLVVNVLSKYICSDCRIPGSVNVPMHKLARVFRSYARDTQIVLHCVGIDCPLSKYAFEALSGLGFTNLKVLDGGLKVWKLNNFPTVGRCKARYLEL